METKKLCEVTVAADSLEMRQLVDMSSRALARLIGMDVGQPKHSRPYRELQGGWAALTGQGSGCSCHAPVVVNIVSATAEGRSPNEIREAFNLPDDLTEEEKLQPVKNLVDDPRIRLLNRLYAKKRQVSGVGWARS
jgi:hypothetical protein